MNQLSFYILRVTGSSSEMPTIDIQHMAVPNLIRLAPLECWFIAVLSSNGDDGFRCGRLLHNGTVRPIDTAVTKPVPDDDRGLFQRED